MPTLPRIAAAALVALAAALLLMSRSLGWGGVEAPDGTRYKVSPVGVSHVLNPDQPVSATRDCSWSPPSGDAALCAERPGGAAAFTRLRLVPRVVDLAVVLCVAAAMLLVVPGSRWAGLREGMPAAAMATALAAPALFATSAPEALAALRGLPFGVGGTLGTLEVAGAAGLLAGLAAGLARRRAAHALLLLPLAAFVSMFPLPGSLGFAVATLAIGFAAGKWVRGERHAAPAAAPAVQPGTL